MNTVVETSRFSISDNSFLQDTILHLCDEHEIEVNKDSFRLGILTTKYSALTITTLLWKMTSKITKKPTCFQRIKHFCMRIFQRLCCQGFELATMNDT